MNNGGKGSHSPIGIGMHGFTQEGLEKLHWSTTGVYAALIMIVFVPATILDCATNHDFIYWCMLMIAGKAGSSWVNTVAPVTAFVGMLAIPAFIGIHIFRASGEIELINSLETDEKINGSLAKKTTHASVVEMYSRIMSNVGQGFIFFTVVVNVGGFFVWEIQGGLLDGVGGLMELIKLVLGLGVAVVLSLVILVCSHLAFPVIPKLVMSTRNGYELGALQKVKRDAHRTKVLDDAGLKAHPPAGWKP